MPKYQVINCREFRSKNRNNKKELTEFKTVIFKKNNYIVDLKKSLIKKESSVDFLNKSYNFLYNTYCKLFEVYTGLENSHIKLKQENKIIQENYENLLEEFIENEIENEIEN